MTLYIGVDIHARQQTVSYLETSDGTTGQVVLDHERDDVKEFYRKLQGEVIIGIEACGYTNWFEELIEQLGHKLLVGDAAEIRRLARRRQKNDRRDADFGGRSKDWLKVKTRVGIQQMQKRIESWGHR